MRRPCTTVGAALVLAVLTGCGPERVCPPIGWSSTVVVELAPEWTDVLTETRDRDPDAAHRTGDPVPDTVLVARRR